jgi:hypothetical protein
LLLVLVVTSATAQAQPGSGPPRADWAAFWQESASDNRDDKPFWGTLSGKQTVQAPDGATAWQDPARSRAWQAEQAWNCELVGPFEVFGQVGASAEEAAKQGSKATGRTGLACQVPAPLGAELRLRGGRSLECSDPFRPDRVQTRPEVFVEVQGKVPLVAGLALEFQGSAVPALAPTERDRLLQDIRLAVPVGSAGKLKLGAQQRWEGHVDPRALPDTSQLYLRLELTR